MILARTRLRNWHRFASIVSLTPAGSQSLGDCAHLHASCKDNMPKTNVTSTNLTAKQEQLNSIPQLLRVVGQANHSTPYWTRRSWRAYPLPYKRRPCCRRRGCDRRRSVVAGRAQPYQPACALVGTSYAGLSRLSALPLSNGVAHRKSLLRPPINNSISPIWRRVFLRLTVARP